MVYDNLFGPWGQIIFVTFGACIILIAILLVACFLTPGCLGYECIRRRSKEDKSIPLRYKGRPNENVKLNDVSYRSWRLGSLYDNGTSDCISENPESQRESVNSNNVLSFEPIDTSSTVNLINSDKPKKDNNGKEFPTELTMSLQYLPPGDENITGKLVIGIEALSGLPPKQYSCTLEPYVALNIVKLSWTNRKKTKLHSFRTRGVRHTASPIYRETFVVANIKPREAKDWTLEIIAYDHDRYANHTELCALRVPLNEVKKLFQSPEIHLLNFQMKQSYQEFGDILLGISYLPTAQRLTINIMRLCNLKFQSAVANLSDFNPYVRVLMLNGKTGRKMKKKKTKFLRATAEPEYNEVLTFDLTLNQLDYVQFLVILCSKVILYESPNCDHPSDSEDSVNSYKRTPDVFIGKVALGKGVRGPTERMHWFSVFQNPRKVVSSWHALK